MAITVTLAPDQVTPVFDALSRSDGIYFVTDTTGTAVLRLLVVGLEADRKDDTVFQFVVGPSLTDVQAKFPNALEVKEIIP